MNFGNYNPIAIDMKKLCSEALKEIDSGKEVEDALSEASKKLYAENAEGALMVINLTLIRLKHMEKGTKLENIKKLAKGKGKLYIGFGSKKIIHKKHTAFSNSDEEEGILAEIPEDFRDEFAKIRKLMKNPEAKSTIIELRKNPIFNFKISKKKSEKSVSDTVQRRVIRCSKCDYMNPNESNKCINCGAELKKSFFGKLFGK